MVFSASSLLFRRSPITKRHGESRILRTHPLHLFRIIQNVDEYQTFLPLCSYSKVDHDTISHDGRTFDATLVVGKPPLFSEEYISRVSVRPDSLRIDTTSIWTKNGQFDSLKSTWQLRPVKLPRPTDDDENDDVGEAQGNESYSYSDHHHAIGREEDPTLIRLPPPHCDVGCHVDLEVEMTVSDPFVVSILDQILMHVAGKQVEAFDRRCRVVPFPSVELLDAAERLHKVPES